MITNPIPNSNLFATRPLDEIVADIEALPPQQRSLVFSFVMATVNACHDLVQKELDTVVA
jgi:cell division protein ZapA (FtsZ GTPase activity inhibitor)